MAEYTSFELRYALDNRDAQEDANMSATQNKGFADVSLLPSGTDSPKVFTQEHNFNVLDGSLGTDIGTIGFHSTSKSDSNGLFAVNPTITATFGSQHKSYITTFHFVEDSPTKVQVSWYLNNVLVYAMEQEWDGNSPVCTVAHAIEAYDKIIIEFLEALPDRYIKLNRIEFGTTMYWDETILKSGTMVKGINRLSSMLSIDTLDFELVDTTNTLNFGNPTGLHTLFRKEQAMYPIEVLDGTPITLGKFFLDTFTTEGNVGKIHAYSYMGLLDKIPYNEGGIYNGDTAASVLGGIFEVAGIPVNSYTIDPVTAAHPLYGTIAPCSCREALQKVLFACNSIINTTDPDHIIISKYSNIITNDITRATKVSTKVTNLDFVSGVKLKYHTYQLEAEAKEVAKEVYSAGKHTVSFGSPYADLTATGTGVTVHKVSTYYIEFTSDGAHEVTITGKQYIKTDKFVLLNRDIPSGQTENVEEYETDLCSTDTANDLVDKIIDYHNHTLSLNVQHYAADVIMDNSHLIDNPNESLSGFIGMFESRTLDLTGGFLDTAVLVGSYDISNKYYWTGYPGATAQGITDELYCGEGALGII